MTSESQILRRYLLGDLSKEESEDLDFQLIAGDQLEERLIRAEEDLIEDYLDHSLSSNDLELFLRNFLASTDRKARARELAVLKQYARNSAKTLHEGTLGARVEIKTNRWPGLSGFRLRLSYALAFLVVLLAVGIGWLAFVRGRTTLPQQELAELNNRDFSDTSIYQGASHLSLASGTFRDTVTPKRLIEANLTENVFFQLEVPTGDLRTYRVVVQRAGTIIATLNETRVYRNSAGQEARLLLPRSLLSKGQFQIRLENPENSNMSLSYAFIVE